ncbi:AraC family transcriptional regulator [Streptomyces sp. NPDC018964]|uniref:AraC family transcriptional regulator n=1 Tax=unclassified Streptomyces TaxID=2593676 RepID=UPI0037AC7C37
MDPLEDVLDLLDVRGHVSAGFVAGGDWAVGFAPPSGVKFNTVRKGRCCLTVGESVRVPLAEGDCFLLTRPVSFVLGSAWDRTPVDAEPLFTAAGDTTVRVGSGDDTVLVGGGFSFGDRARTLLLDFLPPLIHIPADTPQADAVRWALTQIARELNHRSPGSRLVVEHLAVVMLVHVLRLHLTRETAAGPGWPAGLADPVVAPVLSAVHDRPAHPWTVAELAAVARVSRSALAARFKDVVGRPPLDYLTRWRIELASRDLRQGREPLATIARRVGYGSESALSTAFKRVTGVSPSDYRGAGRARRGS